MKYQVEKKVKGKWVKDNRIVNISKDSAAAMNVDSKENNIRYVAVKKVKK